MAKRRVKYISATQIERFLFCPMSYYFVYCKKVERGDPNIYIVFGSAIHEAIALNFQQKIKSKVDLPVDEVVKYFFKIFDEEWAKGVTLNKWDKPDLTRMQGEIMIRMYMKEKAPKIMPLLVEHKFEIKMKGFPVTILGYIDLVTEDGIIIDHKTAGKTTFKNWNQKTVDKSNQLTIYAIAFRKMFGYPEKGVGVDVLVRQPNPEFFRVTSTRTDTQLLSLLQLMTRMVQVIENDLYYPNLNNCDKCEFKATCPRIITDVDNFTL